MTRHCCQLECPKPAEYEILALTGDPEDTTDACTDHVGNLLGSTTQAAWGSYDFNIHPLEEVLA